MIFRIIIKATTNGGDAIVSTDESVRVNVEAEQGKWMVHDATQVAHAHLLGVAEQIKKSGKDNH